MYLIIQASFKLINLGYQINKLKHNNIKILL